MKNCKEKKPDKHEPNRLFVSKKSSSGPDAKNSWRNGGKCSYGVVDGIAGPTTKAFCDPPFWKSLESLGPVK